MMDCVEGISSDYCTTFQWNQRETDFNGQRSRSQFPFILVSYAQKKWFVWHKHSLEVIDKLIRYDIRGERLKVTINA